MKWRPIATAPKDGRNILIYADGFQYIVNYGEDGFWYVYDGDNNHFYRGTDPTYWMPLPDKK